MLNLPSVILGFVVIISFCQPLGREIKKKSRSFLSNMKKTAVVLMHGQATESFRELRCSSSSWTLSPTQHFALRAKIILLLEQLSHATLSWFRFLLLLFGMKESLHGIHEVIKSRTLESFFWFYLTAWFQLDIFAVTASDYFNVCGAFVWLLINTSPNSPSHLLTLHTAVPFPLSDSYSASTRIDTSWGNEKEKLPLFLYTNSNTLYAVTVEKSFSAFTK